MEVNFKCKNCAVCLGKVCLNQLPGMGGVDDNKNFISNCKAWSEISSGPFFNQNVKIRLAPMTGAVENAGYGCERDFYFDLVNQCVKSDIPLSIGDGCPDEKLLWGIEAVESVHKKAAVFIKPYENKKILERIEWSEKIAESIGIDIDAYNIVTMRNKVNLEKKTEANLREIKNTLSGKGLPFILKGIFTSEDIELVRQIKPDVALVSNHGGRVPTVTGSSAEFLAANAEELKKYCGQLWVDGGIRYKRDVEKAASWGVQEVLLGRPFVTALCYKKSFEEVLK